MAKADFDFKYEVESQLGIISENDYGWTIELNKISWNGKPAKYDIRSWAPDHERMGKGISLSAKELELLQKKLNELFPENK